MGGDGVSGRGEQSGGCVDQLDGDLRASDALAHHAQGDAAVNLVTRDDEVDLRGGDVDQGQRPVVDVDCHASQRGGEGVVDDIGFGQLPGVPGQVGAEDRQDGVGGEGAGRVVGGVDDRSE